MIKRRVCYIIMLAAVVSMVMLYDFSGMRFLLACLLIIPLGSLLLLIPQAFLCRFILGGSEERLYRGEKTALSMMLENRSFLPVGRVLLKGRLCLPGEANVKVRQYFFGVGIKDSKTMELSLEARHCGKVSLEAARVRVFDLLGLFSLPMRKTGDFTAYVLPQLDPAYGQELERVARGYAETQDDDIYVRGYRQGDTMHRVYWKLSVKAGELQVRDYESGNAVSLYLNFQQELSRRAENWDAYLDKARSLLEYLTRDGQNVTEVVWSRGECFCRFSVHSIEETVACMCAVLGREDKNTAYWETSVFNLEEGYRLDGDGRLYLAGAWFL